MARGATPRGPALALTPAVRQDTGVGRWAAALLGALGLLFAAGSSTPTLRLEPAQAQSSPITHVVIIFQENHTFDDVLGRFCDQVRTGKIVHDECDGVTKGTLPDGSTIDLKDEPDIVPNVSHSVSSQKRAIDGGKMDGFGLNGGCTADKGYACYAQFDPSRIPNFAALATTFVISDRTFEFAKTPSWAGHMVLGSATLDGFQGDNPVVSEFSPPQTGPGWGCDSFLDQKWWNGQKFVLMPSCVPDQNGNGPYRPSSVPYVPTIFDRLDGAGRTWRIYGGVGGPGSGYGWTICPTFYECLGSAQRSNLVAASAVLADAKAGRLPSFAIVTPKGPNSQHNGNSMTLGDNWIGRVMRAIQNGPNWSSTAVFITYDDCGCFYDHVPPPDTSHGIRVPMVIASPYAKPGFTDSTDANYLSMLAFTEHTYGLAPLAPGDANAYDYAGSFNFAQKPLGPAPMTQRGIPAWERRWIEDHPLDPDDPT
jgi:phospholipase C